MGLLTTFTGRIKGVMKKHGWFKRHVPKWSEVDVRYIMEGTGRIKLIKERTCEVCFRTKQI